ncbi:homeobox-leucine zipper protein HAT5-like [Mangifera indica]|uniref:homeobox-leucine zipper protein HAT5-like n=1 Tax=Mangifera indica TaxID=29780 RepID=UPI001CFAEDBC|nr:homeobox-leucine zipper protein HAT5-like [Mangifera indica]
MTKEQKAMAGGKICGSSNVPPLLRNEKLPGSPQVLDSFWMPKRSSPLHGPESVVNFDDVAGGDTTVSPFFQSRVKEENCYADFDACFNQPAGKKRRLTASQVQFLEKNFEAENKLEPERKAQLAKELGLQPRQVAIWFQNRRARFKNQRLEKDYDSLKAVHDKLQDDYDNLIKEKQALENEVLLLREKLNGRENEKENLETIDAIKQVTTETVSIVPIVACKQEDAFSAKSDIFDSDSPHYTDGNHSSMVEPGDSSQIFEPDQSDFSQDEEDNNLGRNPLPPPCFLKLEDCYYDDPPTTSCNFGFSVEDQPIWSWSY